jgi:hypothetical protein
MVLFGMTCEGRKQNQKMLKIFSPKTRFSKLWFQLPDLCFQICKYNHDLFYAGIKTPKLFSTVVKEGIIEIEQEWIEGDNLTNLLPKLELSPLLDLFTKLLCMQRQTYNYNPSLRIDLNIDNFIINSIGELYLVDITPPLYLKAIPYPYSFAEQCYFHLCFSRINQICELLFTFLKKTVLPSFNRVNISSIFNTLIDRADEIWENEIESIRKRFDKVNDLNYEAYDRTLARLKVVNEFCNNKINPQQFERVLREMSISNILKNHPAKD